MVEFEILGLRRFEMPWRLVCLLQVDSYKESKSWPDNNLVHLVCHTIPHRMLLQLPHGGWTDIRVRNSRSSRKIDGALKALDIRCSDPPVPKDELGSGFLKFVTCLERIMPEERADAKELCLTRASAHLTWRRHRFCAFRVSRRLRLRQQRIH